MKIQKFNYVKENKEVRNVELYVLSNSETSFEGIDLSQLNDNEKSEIKNIVDDYYNKLKPYFFKYRKFNKINIIDKIETKDL
jgi:2-oxo-4-hydroxy-4-carboxy--5-ureidoimidazoline (OHCU) decarboxylase